MQVQKRIQISGRVIEQQTGRGSKSERSAILLETMQGTFILRRQGGHPFADPELKKLLGQTIHCTGILTANTLIMSVWKVEAV